MSIYDKYETVVGLEVHTQLFTQSKAFSSDTNAYGAMPNTNVSVISLGHPGTLPRTNKKAVEFAVKLGIACHCKITEVNQYARKNYFYADLPKGYQITQDTTPICRGGYITIKMDDGNEKQINLHRIHMEEDAGKSMHDQDAYDSLIDLNRAGVPLLEMVTEPELTSIDEAYKFLTEVRKLVRYLDVCDGNMEEGSMRCDANVSVRLKGEKKLGAKVEVKNMNSIRNVARAIEHEVKRQIDLIESGEKIDQETRSFDASNGTTFSLRSKEMANDYRYFPEPDLPPIIITEAYIEQVRATMPALPDELFKKYNTELGLSAYDATNITESKELALFFESILKYTQNYKAAANWLMGPVKSYINSNAVHITRFPISAEKIASLVDLVESGKVSYSVASQKIFPAMIEKPTENALHIAETMNLIQDSDSDSINEMVKAAVAKFPDKVKEYKSGKVGLLGLFMGEVMKMSKGKADPKLANQLVKDYLDGLN